jgi:NTP pyrophosphatase (non-canonical NTP hydrolase)
MSLAATLRAITSASAHMPTTPTKTLQRIAEHPAMVALADVESIKKWMRRTADHHTTDLADPDARTYILLGLLGEIGELVAEALRPDPDRAKIISEAGDVLWSLDALLAQHGADLSDAVAALEHKMLTRPTTSPRMAAAGYRPAPTTIEALLREPGWIPYHKGAQHDLPDGANLTVENCIVAILDSQDNDVTRAEHPTVAAAIRAALDIVAALNQR